MANNGFCQYQEEIAYRAELQKKVIGGEKPTEEEKLWMETHKKFSQIHGIPYLMRDIIQLEQGAEYRFDVEFVESSHPTTHPNAIYPLFKVPRLIGSIKTDVELADYRGKKSIGKPVKMLAALISADDRHFSFDYSSDCGVLLVEFSCRYYDQKIRLNTGRNSGDSEGLYMLREDVGQNRVLYHCKAPYAESFDSLIFSVKWNTVAVGG